MPVLARMETLRRATVYAMKNPRIAQELLARLMARAQQAEAAGKPDAMALFDAGYLVEAYKQADWAFKRNNPAKALDGYSMVLKAIRLQGEDPTMEFAAALISVEPQRHAHVQKALAGADEGTLLAKNLVLHNHLLGIRGNSVAELRAGIASK